jgi:hypothetical protein
METLITNSNVDLIDRVIQRAYVGAGVGAITGLSGLGKTAVTKHKASVLTDDVHYVGLARRAPRKEVLVRLLQQLRPDRALPKGESYVLTAEITERLADRDAVVIIDEAHGLDDVALDSLAHLHSHPDASWTLLLVGSPNLAQNVNRYEHLRSRCTGVLQLDRLPKRELISTVRGLDRMFASTDAWVLHEVDAEYCNGNLREWQSVATTARLIAEGLGSDCESFDEMWASVVVSDLQALKPAAA